MAEEKEEKPRHQVHAEARLAREATAGQSAEYRQRRAAALRMAVDEVLKTPAGRRVWAALFHACGYSVSSLTTRPDGEVAPLSTECKEAQRLIYINLRKLASRELLRGAEDFAEYEDGQSPSPEEKK